MAVSAKRHVKSGSLAKDQCCEQSVSSTVGNTSSALCFVEADVQLCLFKFLLCEAKLPVAKSM